MSLEKYRWDLINCERCNNCLWDHPWRVKDAKYAKICPSNERYLFAAYSCQGRFDIARGLMDGEIKYSDRVLDIIYRCSLCGACDVTCKVYRDMEPLEILQELRVKCVEDGQGPLPAHKPIIDSVKSYDNVWMQPRGRRNAWAKGLNIKDLNKEKAEVLYYVGCTYAYEPRLQKVPQNTANLLKKAGVDFGILGNKEFCCGSPILKIGDRKLYESYAQKNIEAFNRLGVKKVVTSCAGCYGLFKAHYPAVGKMGFEVLHITEYIEQLIEEGKITFSKELPLAVTWHDPCHIGRLGEPYVPWEGKRAKYGLYDPPKKLNRGTNGVYEPPRNVLRSIPGIDLIEMERIKEFSWCCASGGGVKSAFPDFAIWSARERINEAKSTGADALVTSCPWCEANFMDANEEEQSGEIKLYDLVDLVLQVI